MITKRPSHKRGHFDHGWLDTRHTFSFARYHDRRYTSFRDLLVVNEDRVQPSRGFLTHSHDNMEIISYVLEGALEHRDSLGNGSIIRPGDVQRMSAGTGVTHSEFNPSPTEPVHFLQIWITPDEQDLKPSYEQRTIAPAELQDTLRLVAATDGGDDAVTIHQDAKVFASRITAGASLAHKLGPGRHAWIQVIDGVLKLNGLSLTSGDGAAVSDEEQLRLDALAPSHFVLFDLA
ncbi:MAG: quercetin 2,3-dioxygenase [Candidatus Rokuibacteriota bacterium]|nr:MAG: quercetin 2,3-dioxygenase [Candidatus Rokubacteria bacterium]